MITKNIPLFCSGPIYFVNFDEWDLSRYHILFLTGLSGSGKTHMGQALSTSTGAVLISLDALKFYDAACAQSRHAVDEFVALHPEIIPLIAIQWSKTDAANTNDLKYTEYCRKFFDFLCTRAERSESLYIVEGIQLFVRIQWEKIINAPLGVMGTSGLRSFYNTYQRDYVTKQKPRQLSLMWREFRLYHCAQRKLLNQFLDFLNTRPSDV